MAPGPGIRRLDDRRPEPGQLRRRHLPQRFDELREELVAQCITLGVAHAKHRLGRAFDPRWFKQRLSAAATPAFPTLRSAVRAFREAPVRQHATRRRWTRRERLRRVHHPMRPASRLRSDDR
jgi:hypothetical protein